MEYRAQIENLCSVGNKFFKSSQQNKIKLAPKKGILKIKIFIEVIFSSDVNGKEGLDIGDTKELESMQKILKINILNI